MLADICMNVARGAGVVPTQNATSNSGTTALYGVSSGSWSHTTPVGTTILVVSLCLYANAQTVTGATYNGSAMTLVTSETSGSYQTYIYSVANPATGSQSIAFTYSGTAYGMAAAATFSNAQTAAGATGTGHAISTGPASVSITTTAANSVVVDALTTDGSDSDPTTAGAAQVVNMKQRTGNSNQHGQSYKPVAAAGATTMTYTFNSGTASWSMCAVEIKA